MLCEPATQRASLAPLRDLARLSERLAGELDGQAGMLPLQLDLLHDARLGEAPLSESRPLPLRPGGQRYDVVFMPAGDDPVAGEPWDDAARSAWLRWQHGIGAWVAGLGSGVLALAAAGLLDGGPASVPPRHARQVRQLHPQIRLAHIGALAEHGRVLTAAEPASVFALVVALTRRFHSHGLAERYRRACGLPETAVPDNALLPMRNNQDLLIAEARAWIIAHMHDDIDMGAVAAQFHVSTRTLARRFERSMGITPARYLREARLDAARSMLHRTRFSIEQIAHLVGYRDVGFFRDLFRKSSGCSPRAYRMAAQ
ncbi:transcriptional regulator [Rhizorhabdus dicambivorans]|uniref:Transcriptional regulator n=2 Tax=Rhizorhabdus dicambivorans TaxID=1850238 RepID=A0A2A4FVV3_9SPHN|nr:transcriptional regulator [Rhizorhabdus dicambivorans]PCE41521.1 transcriptional regulator [Rhizorhabdus dicambivorans]